MMKIWFTNQGQKTLKTIASICKGGSHRILIVVGCNQVDPLLDYLNKRCRLSRVDELKNIEDLAEMGVVDGNHCILLHSLVSRSVKNPIEYLNRYCRQRKYQLIYAPFSLRRNDIENLYQYELDAGFGKTCSGNTWVLDIAHETALLLSMGILNCYCGIREIFLMAYKQNPDQLPDARQCMLDYSRGQEQQEDAQLVKVQMRGTGGIERLIRDPDDDDWLVLWSVGLAGKYNGMWQLSPFLLESPKMYREMQYRLQRAIHSTVVPIYQAWVYYCEKKYNLRELDEEKQLMPWYPKTVLEALEQSGIAEKEELELCKEVRALRNWVQHDEGENQDGFLRDYRQTRVNVLRTCAKVISKIDPNGNLR